MELKTALLPNLNKYKFYRMKAGLTQAVAAKKIGVTQGTVSAWELGRSNPTAKLLPIVAKTYKTKIDALLI